MTFADVLLEARTLLNDPGGAIFMNAPMITLGNKAYRELQTKVSTLGIGTTKEVSADIDVDAGTIALSAGAGLPADLLYPVFLEERTQGSSERYIDMTESEWEPDIDPGTRLEFWSWREDELKFPECATDREVRIRYAKTLGSIDATTSPILIINSQQYLACRTAALSARYLGSNPGRADALDMDLVTLWDDLRLTLVRRQQNIPVRRRRTRFRVY